MMEKAESWVCSGPRGMQFWKDLPAVFNYLMGGCGKDTSWRHSGRMRGNGHGLEHGKFQLNTGNIFITANMVKHWN